VRHLTVVGRVFHSRGFGVRIHRVLAKCPRLRTLALVGIDDLKPKHLVSTVTHLSVLNSSFRPHALVDPPSLELAVSALTHLTLSNVGMPPPSTHLSTLVHLAAPTLTYLAVSSLRDVDLAEFRTALATLARECTSLDTLVLGFLTDEHVTALCLPPTTTSDGREQQYPVLSELTRLENLTFTLPHPNLDLVLSIPATLSTLTVRQPYNRTVTTGTGTVVTGHSRQALLACLNPVPSPSTTHTRGTNTPSPSPSHPMTTGQSRRLPPLEVLEEEERVLSDLARALLPDPPPLSTTATTTVRKGHVVVAEAGLGEIRWECRGLRGGRDRANEIMAERARILLGRGRPR
jgi:hypothetical protein